MSRLREWSTEITVVIALVAGLAYMHGQHDNIRADMREEMRAGFSEMREEHAEIRDRLNSIDRRTSRIEGHLFGVEIVPEPADGE